ncbi:phosphate transport system substrate-binding protein [Leifsonia sp. AK011]|uniref:phosphate ABC transporter substrate-binding protein PstS n=1 Tax=Leifsonia sp. AK011 TaxID=2723075 RepID=UPI0015C829E0|nr:phosphate ABC transporter substrate-binding protein PstS [Leifsonia sp. AK011]NYF09791.1 phosphate transport system substrate-binding protein [Leifsonia sp. AK011]
MIERGLLVCTAGVLAALLLSGCAVNEQGDTPSDLAGTIDGSGASSQGSAQEVWVAGFQRANAGVSVNYDPVGSGAGRQAFLAGGADFAGSDTPLSEEELAGELPGCAPGSEAIDLPLYISPIAVVFSIAGVDELRLDAASLARIFSGEITRWDDAALVDLNPGVSLPAAEITAVHRSDDSGTTTNFTEYLHAVAPEAWPAEPSGTFPFRSGESALGNSGIVGAVDGGVGTIGYVDASKAGDLAIASILVGDEFVQPSAAGAAALVDLSPRLPGRGEHDIALEVDRTSTAQGVYPLVLISYLIACQEYGDANTGEIVRGYLEHIASPEGQAAAEEIAGSAPLAPGLLAEVQAAVASIR